MCPYELTVCQQVSSWHWNLLHHHCAVMERSISGGRLFKIFEWSLWFSYLQENQHFSSCKNVCLLYAAVPSGELLEAYENWVVSPSQITSRFVTVSRLWLAISDLHSVLMMSLCSCSEAAQTHDCRVPGVNNFKIWPQCSGLVLFRFKRHVENGKNTYGE